MGTRQGDLLWTPSRERIEASRLTGFSRWLASNRGLRLDTYADLYQWSVRDLEGFWGAVWAYFEVSAHQPYERVLASRTMPGATWFSGSTLNYAENALRRVRPEAEALVFRSETRAPGTMKGDELRTRVAAVAAGLRELGVGPGDRVVAYLPNTPEAVVALLACASIGAIWSSCSPDFGTQSVVDRFRQIDPKVLLTIDGYRYGGRDIDRRAEAAEIQGALPSLRETFNVPYLFEGSSRGQTKCFHELWNTSGAEVEFTPVPFEHPLWVLYSSGTTGLPKALVQSQGGILLEHLKVLAFHNEIDASDRLFWFTTTGWMMWNYIVSGLLHGSAVVLFDGHPGYPDMGVLWDLAEDAGVTYFGTSAAYLGACIKSGVRPAEGRDLSKIKGVGSTGSPLAPEGFSWVYEHVGQDLCLGSLSGGSDVCSAFVGSTETLPVRAGEIQVRCLGVAMESWDEHGRALVDSLGEMVITEPMPSMPIYLWGDSDHQRYKQSYFQTYPGVWRHGDFVRLLKSGSVVISGRSDSTLNRHGVRIGTAEIYRTVEDMPEIQEALVVNVERKDGQLFMPLFVALSPGLVLDDELQDQIRTRLRERCSPRHVPDAILAVEAIPKTLNGKKMEVPVRRVLAGEPLEQVMNRDAAQNPDAMTPFVEMAEGLQP